MAQLLERALMRANGGAFTEGDLLSPREARQWWAIFRGEEGMAPIARPLLTPPQAQPKAGKNELPTYLLHLSPADGSGQWNVCPWATSGCRAACLNTAGRGQFDEVQRGRQVRTRFFGAHPKAFLTLITHEIDLAVRRHGRVAVRLNGTSDIRWEVLAPFLFERWGEAVVFYDYTKSPTRQVPDNYHLTYSVNERDSVLSIRRKLERYGRAAIVLDTKKNEPLPDTWHGMPVVDGDKDDQRWLDHGVLVGLRAKGEAKHDTSGFVRPKEGHSAEAAA